MTYAREPMTFEAALDMIVDRVGEPTALRAVDRARRSVANWSNPHSPVTPPIAAALALDCAWRAAGGAGAPLLDTYRRLFEASAPIVIEQRNLTLAEATVSVIKEGSEAKAALVRAMQPNATDCQRREATREVVEGIVAMEATLPLLMVQQPP